MADRPIKALSIMQPWAWLIVAGHKNVENRTWPTSFRGPVLTHAGKKADAHFMPPYWEWSHITPPEAFNFGDIIGRAEIIDCTRDSVSEWFHGPYGFVLDNMEPMPFQPCRGALGFFVPDFSPVTPRQPREKAPRPPKPQGVLF
jgi:hypothetical protein